ncbi:MAG: acyltransferase family protein, partial [Bdellovibrionota bacterium]
KSRNPEFGAHLFGNWHGMVREALAVVTMRYNYLLHQLSPGILGVYWSLSVEEHFYLFLPLGLILFVSRHARVGFALFCMAAATLLIRPWIALASGGSGWLWVPYLTHTRFDALMAGVLIAVLMEAAQVQRNWFSNRKLRAVLVLAGLVGVWVFPNLYMDARFYGLGYTLTWISAGILVLLAGLNSGMVLEYRFLKTSLEYLGSRSYGIYLIHVPAGHIIEAIGHSQKMVATAYFDGLAELCYRILERPCIAVGHAITSSWLLDHHNVKTAPGIKSPLAAVET